MSRLLFLFLLFWGRGTDKVLITALWKFTEKSKIHISDPPRWNCLQVWKKARWDVEKCWKLLCAQKQCWKFLMKFLHNSVILGVFNDFWRSKMQKCSEKLTTEKCICEIWVLKIRSGKVYFWKSKRRPIYILTESIGLLWV